MNVQRYVRDVTFECDNLTLWEGILLKDIVEAFQKGKKVKIETDEEFEARVASWQDAERIKREEAKKRKATQDEKDRKEFERLSRKFGPT